MQLSERLSQKSNTPRIFNMSSSSLNTIDKKHWICTESDVARITCKWTVTTLQLLLKKNGEAIRSPLFYTGNGKEQWRLELFPRGIDENHANSVCCYLHLESSETLGIHAEFKISILKLNETMDEGTFKHKFDKLEACGYAEFIELSKLLGSNCSEITIILLCNTDMVSNKQQKVSIDSHTVLSENFRLFYENPKFSDVTIIVGDYKFPAHRSILSVRSPMVATIFVQEGIGENRKNKVKIEDMEPAVVRGLLEYIYTGEVAELDVLANGLMGAAEKYNLEVLKAVCEETLCKNLEVANAAEILMLANLYRARGLEEDAMEFIKDNLYDVIQTNGYKEMNDPSLLKQIISFNAGET